MASGRWIWLVIVAALLLAASQAVHAQEPARLALLIGNQGYAAKVGALKNPHTDVALIEAALTKLGFKVVVLKDANHRAMDTAIKRHVREVNRAGAGALSFFYYSGHGVANPETKVNYLIPVDVTETEDEKIWDEAYQQNAVIDLLSQQAPRATHFVVFDACRNELNITGPAAKSLGADKGFVPIQNTAGLLIAYATAPGKTASDVGAGGGPYATALADELVKPGVEAVSMFRAVQIRVKQAINQDPWLSFPSLPPTFLAGRSASPPAATPTAPTASQPPMSEAGQAWTVAKDATNVAVLEAFVRRFGDSFYGDLARARIEEMRTSQVAVVAPPPKAAAPQPVPSAKQVAIPTGVFFRAQTETQSLVGTGDLIGAHVRDGSGTPLGTIEAIIVERGATVGLVLDHQGKPIGLRSPSPQVSINAAARTVTLDIAQAASVLTALDRYQKRGGEELGPGSRAKQAAVAPVDAGATQSPSWTRTKTLACLAAQSSQDNLSFSPNKDAIGAKAIRIRTWGIDVFVTEVRIETGLRSQKEFGISSHDMNRLVAANQYSSELSVDGSKLISAVNVSYRNAFRQAGSTAPPSICIEGLY